MTMTSNFMGFGAPKTLLLCAIFLAPGTALAAEPKANITAPPAIYTDLVACKTIADPTQRLACFDEKIAALETAQTNKEVVIADRQQVEEARRGLFGLSLPRIKLFGGDDDDSGQVDQIESKIASVRQLRSGKWLIRLEDGASWQQTSGRSSMRPPRAGDSIVIKRAALGSFMAKVNDGRGFKIKRVVN